MPGLALQPLLLLARLYPERPTSPLERVMLVVTILVLAVVCVRFVVSRLRELPHRPPGGGVPIDEWRRRGLGVQPSEGVTTLQPGQRCPLCRLEHQPTSEAARCDGCGAVLHLLCARDLGRCATLGCAGTARRVDAVVG